jgi:hypothetical protein
VTNLLFRDRDGRDGEYGVILLHHNGLYVLELKGWHGRITGDQFTWTVTAPNGQVRQEGDLVQTGDGKAKGCLAMVDWRPAEHLRLVLDAVHHRGEPADTPERREPAQPPCVGSALWGRAGL